MLRIEAFRFVQVVFLYEHDVVFGACYGPKEDRKPVIGFEAVGVD